jgi:hypothetical protein
MMRIVAFILLCLHPNVFDCLHNYEHTNVKLFLDLGIILTLEVKCTMNILRTWFLMEHNHFPGRGGRIKS